MRRMLWRRLPGASHRGVFHAIRRKNMVVGECPECAGEVKFKDTPVLHELIRCGDCGVELEVVALDPISLALAPTEEEDWGE